MYGSLLEMNREEEFNPTVWWIVGLLMKNINPDDAAFWLNYRIYKASSWRQAFEKAVADGKSDCGDLQEFKGISDLLPIYDEFADGAEIMYQRMDEAPEVFSAEDLAKEIENNDQSTNVE